MSTNTPTSIRMRLLSVALFCCVTIAGCGGGKTPPGPTSSFGMVEPDTHFQFLLWDEGLAIMFVDTMMVAHHSGGRGSTTDPVRRQRGSALSKTGDRYDWEIETTDGRTATLKINSVEYEIAKGAVFVIQMKDKKPTVDQLDLDVSKLSDVASCRAFIKENRDALKLSDTEPEQK